MRALFWTLAILALATALTVAGKYNTGYVVVVYPPYRVELSLSLMIVLLLAAFFLAYGLLRLGINTLNLPDQVRAFRDRRQREKARAALLASMRDFAAGRYAKAEKHAVEALELGEEPEVGTLVAARSAHALGAVERRDAYLAQRGKTCADYPEAGMAESHETIGAAMEKPSSVAPPPSERSTPPAASA